MNLVNQTLKMNSREIAALTNKEHKHVKRDIEVMLEQLELDKSNFGRIYLDSLNRQQTEYALDRELTEVLVTGYSPKLRLAVIRRLKELEQQVTAPALPTTYLEALKALLASEEKIEADAKKVNHYDTIVDRTGLVIATNIGNKLGISATKLNRLLDDLDVYNKRTNKRAFKQWFINEGYGIAKQAHMGFNQCLFTLKGEAWIVEQLTMAKAVPEADIERVTIRRQHTESVIDLVNNLLVY